MKTKTKEIMNDRTGRHALRGEIMTGKQKHIYEVGGKIQEQPKPEIRTLIKEIERILGIYGYRRFIQLGFPGEFRASYVKGNRIITISDIPEALEMQISSVKTLYEAIKGSSRGRTNGRRKKQKKNKNVQTKKSNHQMKNTKNKNVQMQNEQMKKGNQSKNKNAQTKTGNQSTNRNAQMKKRRKAG